MLIKNPRHAASLAYAIVALHDAMLIGDEDKIFIAQCYVKAVEAKIRQIS